MIFRSMLKLSYSLEKNSASILVGNVMKPPRRTTTSAKHAASERKKEKLRRKRAFRKVLIDATRKISRNQREREGETASISIIKGGEITERHEFPLSEEKITILPNRQLFMLNPLRTIGIFSLPTVILSRS